MHTQFSRYRIAGKSGDQCFAFRDKSLSNIYIKPAVYRLSDQKCLLRKKPLGEDIRGTPWLGHSLGQHCSPTTQATHGFQLLHSLCKVPWDPRGSQGQPSPPPSSCSSAGFPVRPAFAEQPHATPQCSLLSPEPGTVCPPAKWPGARLHTHKEHGWMSERPQISSHIPISLHLTLSLLLSSCESSPNSNIHCPLFPALVSQPHTQVLLDSLQFPQSASLTLLAPSSSHLQSPDFSRAKHHLDLWCCISMQSYSKSIKSICTKGRRNMTKSWVKIWRSESELTRNNISNSWDINRNLMLCLINRKC